MTTQTYQQLILEGIKGLPLDLLAEIADFVYFVRQRALQPQVFEEERQAALLRADLRQLSRDEEAHVEQEFADYDQRYPRK
jgi:hypothetical protein